MGVPSGSHIRAIVVLNFFIRVQEERIKVQEELVRKWIWKCIYFC